MTWSPEITRDAVRAAGMTVPCDFTIGVTSYPGIHVKWFQPDKLYLDDQSQQTDYHIEFWTEDLPSIGKGDTLIADGQQYELIEMPAFAEGKSGGHYSRVRLKATTRSYPKLAITHVAASAPGPAQAPSSGSADEFLTRIAAQALGGHRFVCSVSGSTVDYADNTVEAHGDTLLGFTTAAALAGSSVVIQNEGEIEFSGWSWTPNMGVWLGLNGLVTQSPNELPPAKLSVKVGFAITATRIFIEIEEPIYLD